MRIPATLSVAIAATLGVGNLASQQGALGCVAPESPAGPLDSLTVSIGETPVKICYTRVPSSGGLANWGRLREVDAPIVHTPVAVRFGRLEVGPGSYALLPVSQDGEVVIVWIPDPEFVGSVGNTAEREVGSVYGAVEELGRPAETLRVRSEGGGDKVTLFIEWGDTELVIRILLSRLPG